MRFSCLGLILLTISAAFPVLAQEKPVPKTEPAAGTTATTSEEQASTKPANEPAVDAAKVTGSTFESPYFKFTYELPTGWKALDDATRMTDNQMAMQEDIERSRTALAAVKTAAKAGKSASSTNPSPSKPAVLERYSLMAASPGGLDSLASPVLPRINIWANRRVPPLDKPMDHAQLLVTGKHNEILVRPHELQIEGHSFARVQLVNAAGNYQARYITVMGDYLVGFDFLAQSEKDMVEIANSIKSIRFE
jgi:hypothetical protein